jgi:hypothetical protein
MSEQSHCNSQRLLKCREKDNQDKFQNINPIKKHTFLIADKSREKFCTISLN